jgi:NADH-quinone oxidoreductase subunit J
VTASTGLLLYLAFAAGGLGVYFMMPRAERSTVTVGAIFGVAGLLGLFALIGTRLTGVHELGVYFYLFSTIAVAAAARVITHPQPVYSAIYFVLVVIAVAALLVLLAAEFLAVALVIIYAGAILVTYLFVIMLAQQPGSPIYDRQAREPFAAVVAAFILMGAIAGQATALPASARATPAAAFASHTAAVGAIITTKYVVVLEIAGILLLVSMVGAIALSRKRVASDVVRTPRAPLGEVGKDVEPF